MMKKIIYYLIIAFVLFLIIDSCITNPFTNINYDPYDQKRTYSVKTIYKDPKNAYTFEELIYIPVLKVYPREIEFENYVKDLPINKLAGRVDLGLFNWNEISTTHTEMYCFF